MPLAIQLTRDQKRANHVFTPPVVKSVDEYYTTQAGRVWLFAKMHAQTADAQVHEMVSHLGFSHVALETIVLAFNRQLPADHPVLKLIQLHFMELLAINHLGRGTLLKTPDADFDVVLGMSLDCCAFVEPACRLWPKWRLATDAEGLPRLHHIEQRNARQLELSDALVRWRSRRTRLR